MSIKHLIEGEITKVELGFPTVVVGLIAMGIFVILAMITWSYRDVANRHDHKSSNAAHH